MRFRLLPIAVFVAAALLAVKAVELWRGVDAFIAMPSYAQSVPPKSGPHTQSEPPSQDKPGAATDSAAAGAKEWRSGAAARAEGGTGEDPMLMSQSEIDLLQNLAQRRDQLEAWGKDLSLREQLLKAAELRIENKLTELKTLQETIKASLKQHDEEQEAKLKSLVKIYETMKPKDAAPIFEQLDMPILLDVVERMKEAKAAPIIAAMDPVKAKKLTTEMAVRRRIAGEESQRVAEQASRAN